MTPVHELWLLDVLDILIVAALFYRLMSLVKGTRSAQMIVGLLVIVVVGMVANYFDLLAVRWIVSSLKTVWLIVFVILFQPELRHALAQFGRTRYVRSFLRGENYGVLGEVIRAVESLAQRRHGALIVMERNVGLRNFVETGTRIDAKVSAELLVTLFSPGSPLHDGAVIVREDTIVAAACILPLSSNPLTAISLGTRHRAALGLSEETDAAVRHRDGAGLLAHDDDRGVLYPRLDEGQLRSELTRISRTRPQDEPVPAPPTDATSRTAG
ncbi:MAG: diadenylate cyclase CdaA [bacterium]